MNFPRWIGVVWSLALVTVVAALLPAGTAEVDKAAPPPPAKVGAIFTQANVITFSGPMTGGKSITVEGLPVGTTKWLSESPLGRAGKGEPGEFAPVGPTDAPTEARLKALEAQQAQILQVVLDLQKQLGKTPSAK